MRDALHDPDFVVIARTDAIAVEGFAAAIDRASGLPSKPAPKYRLVRRSAAI